MRLLFYSQHFVTEGVLARESSAKSGCNPECAVQLESNNYSVWMFYYELALFLIKSAQYILRPICFEDFVASPIFVILHSPKNNGYET